MWIVEGKTMRPLLDQSHLDVAWHAGQYQALPEIYTQNSALESNGMTRPSKPAPKQPREGTLGAAPAPQTNSATNSE